VVFTGCQPSGKGQGLHLGNYIGAVLPFLKMQADPQFDRRFFCIVDLHSLTTANPRDDESPWSRSEAMFAMALACGIDPARTNLYLQSTVSGHSELFWLLCCRTPVHLLNAMTQWKEKRHAATSHSNAGLYTYPVLMAADILLFRATHVPVGDDQVQHMELTNKIVDTFNAHYQPDLFVRPQLVLHDAQYPTSRIMDLRNPLVKMSKSAASDMARINLSDTNDRIADKIRQAKTDSNPTGRLTYDPTNRPELANLLHIGAALTGTDPPTLAAEFATSGFGRLKERLIEVVVETVAPIARTTEQLLTRDLEELRRCIARAGIQASTLARPHLQRYQQVIIGQPPSWAQFVAEERDQERDRERDRENDASADSF
jgi:tryptophanyl-tRNA synthetase